MRRLFFLLAFFCLPLHLCASVVDSIVPSIDEVYSLNFGKKVNYRQKKLMDFARENKESKVRVMTYNMLYNQKDAEAKLPEKYRWEHRKPRLIEYVLYASPDLIGSQELQQDQVTEVMESWGKKYDYYGEVTRENEGRSDVNAIFYKKDRFELINSEMIAYQNKEFENAFTVCYLRDKNTNSEFVVINTKLTWGDADRRLNEAEQLNQFSQSLPEELPVVILGDFNTFSCFEHKINIFLDGDFVEQAIMGKHLSKAKSKSIFGHFGPICSINNSKTTLKPFAGPELSGFILDHVFVSDSIDVLCHGIDPARVEGEFPSDHLPVLTDLFIH